MTTVINNPDTSTSSSNGLGITLGVLLAIILAIALFVYAVPTLRGGSTTRNESPAPSSSKAEINVPERVQLDVNTPR